MQKVSSSTDRRGFSLIEAILTIAVFGFLVTALAGGYAAGRASASAAGFRTRAVFLAEEGLEAARTLRNQNFSNLPDGTYGLALVGGIWHLAGAPETIDAFTRRLTITTLSAGRRQVTVSVGWSERPGYDRSVTLTSELTNWRVRTR
ncbi:MAG TPA: type II secretion system protein [Candidatus Paceibacterota bacterium]|nr:type II secretion system protein [Candidatus Paceibacterota bacterium]